MLAIFAKPERLTRNSASARSRPRVLKISGGHFRRRGRPPMIIPYWVTGRGRGLLPNELKHSFGSVAEGSSAISGRGGCCRVEGLPRS